MHRGVLWSIQRLCVLQQEAPRCAPETQWAQLFPDGVEGEIKAPCWQCHWVYISRRLFHLLLIMVGVSVPGLPDAQDDPGDPARLLLGELASPDELARSGHNCDWTSLFFLPDPVTRSTSRPPPGGLRQIGPNRRAHWPTRSECGCSQPLNSPLPAMVIARPSLDSGRCRFSR